MKRVINLDNWNRKEHFKFFSALDDPFWGITTTVDFTSIYQQSKNMEVSFFLYSVHFLLKCINIGREDGTFGFGFFEYDTDLSLFIENAEKEIHRVKNSTGLSFSKDTARADVIRYSALPWFAFSEMKHAGSIQTGDSIPKISTGKLIQEKKKLLLPISISVHHGLVDGRNVAEFIQNLKDGQNNTL